MKMNIRWGELLVQMVSVSFGVLFALWINQAIETKRNKNDVHIVLQGLSNELDFNYKFLERRLDYYERMVAEIDSVIEIKGSVTSIDELPSFNGLNPPFLRRSSFDLSLSTGVLKNVDYQLAERISTVYAFQDFYLKMIEMFINKLMTSSGKSMLGENGENIGMIRGTFREWSQVGQELNRSIIELMGTLPPPAENAIKD